MLYILDTDHLSLLQHGNTYVSKNLRTIPVHERAVTVISLMEQIEGRIAAIRRAKTEMGASASFHYLLQTMDFFRLLNVLPYTDNAAAVFNQLRKDKIRIGTQDLRIAAIALSTNATVITRNQRDFNRVPHLQLLDWSVES